MTTARQAAFVSKCPIIRAQCVTLEKLTEEYEREFNNPDRHDDALTEIIGWAQKVVRQLEEIVT